MAAVGSLLNRNIAPVISAADVAAGLGFVALNLDTKGGNVVYIDCVDAHVNVSGADYNNLTFVQVFIVRNIQINPTVALSSQIGAGQEERYFEGVTEFISQRSYSRLFTQPVILEPGAIYSVIIQAFYSAAFVGPAAYSLNVFGRNIPKGHPDFPFQLR